MIEPHGDLGIDEERLRAAGPDGLYLFALEGYPYMMTPDQVAEFTNTTGQEVRRLLRRGEIRGCRVGVKWLVPKISLLDYLYGRARAE